MGGGKLSTSLERGKIGEVGRGGDSCKPREASVLLRSLEIPNSSLSSCFGIASSA